MAGRVLRKSNGQFNGSTRGWNKGKKRKGGSRKKTRGLKRVNHKAQMKAERARLSVKNARLVRAIDAKAFATTTVKAASISAANYGIITHVTGSKKAGLTAAALMTVRNAPAVARSARRFDHSRRVVGVAKRRQAARG